MGFELCLGCVLGFRRETGTTSVPIMLRPVQPIDVDVLPKVTEEDIQQRAHQWVVLVRDVVNGNSTRQRKPEAHFKTLYDPSSAGLLSLAFVRSGLFEAVRAMGDLAQTNDMTVIIDSASVLADKWEKRYGADAPKKLISGHLTYLF